MVVEQIVLAMAGEEVEMVFEEFVRVWAVEEVGPIVEEVVLLVEKIVLAIEVLVQEDEEEF